jgi:hypothetical protein
MKLQSHFGPGVRGLFKLAPCRDIYKKSLVSEKTNLISRDAGIIKAFEHRQKDPVTGSHQPNSVKKITLFFVKKSGLFERSEFPDFRKIM